MYGLPPDFDASVFIGKELEQICFSVNTITFHFGLDVSITVVSLFIYRVATEGPECTETIPLHSSNAMRLLEKTVTSAVGQIDGTLSLTFGDGSNLMFIDDTHQYESYHIRIGNTEIHV